MGFTPMEGLVMATRAGDVDPGALLWLQRRYGLNPDDLEDVLERRSGLLGLSGSSGDLRVVLERRAAGDAAAADAVAVYLHRLCAKVGAMLAALEGADALVFTGGVGEHSSVVRAESCARLGWAGISVDESANLAVGQADVEITGANARVAVLVVHAREELEIARECRRLIGRAA
jgi:acetate kinase